MLPDTPEISQRCQFITFSVGVICLLSYRCPCYYYFVFILQIGRYSGLHELMLQFLRQCVCRAMDEDRDHHGVGRVQASNGPGMSHSGP